MTYTYTYGKRKNGKPCVGRFHKSMRCHSSSNVRSGDFRPSVFKRNLLARRTPHENLFYSSDSAKGGAKEYAIETGNRWRRVKRFHRTFARDVPKIFMSNRPEWKHFLRDLCSFIKPWRSFEQCQVPMNHPRSLITSNCNWPLARYRHVGEGKIVN